MFFRRLYRILYRDVSLVIDIQAVGSTRYIEITVFHKRDLPSGCTFSVRITKINVHDDLKWWMVCKFSNQSLTAGDIYIYSNAFKIMTGFLWNYGPQKLGMIGLSEFLIEAVNLVGYWYQLLLAFIRQKNEERLERRKEHSSRQYISSAAIM